MPDMESDACEPGREDRAVALLYTGGDGSTRERIVVPRRLRTSDDTDWLDAVEPANANTLMSFRLERVGAIRV